jgi:hypothetical protein
MSRIKVLAALLLAGLFALLIPLSIVLAQDVSGTASVQDSDNTEYSNRLSDQLSIELMDLDALPPTMAYEGWLVSDDGSRKESTGILPTDANGNVSETFKLMADGEDTGENLLAAFDKFVVTVEPVPDTDSEPSGEIAAIHQKPMASMAHIRNLTYSAEGNPAYMAGNFHEGTPKGSAVGLREQTGVGIVHAGLSFEGSDLATVQQHACHVVNIIDGTSGASYDAACGNPGDGMGILSYSDTTVMHAGLAASAAPDEAVIVSNAQRAIDGAETAAMWASQARAEALTAKASTDVAIGKIHIGNARDLLNKALGESSDAYMASQAMGSYTIAPAPVTGDYNVPMLALLSLLVGAGLLVSGALVYRRNGATG